MSRAENAFPCCFSTSFPILLLEHIWVVCSWWTVVLKRDLLRRELSSSNSVITNYWNSSIHPTQNHTPKPKYVWNGKTRSSYNAFVFKKITVIYHVSYSTALFNRTRWGGVWTQLRKMWRLSLYCENEMDGLNPVFKNLGSLQRKNANLAI